MSTPVSATTTLITSGLHQFALGGIKELLSKARDVEAKTVTTAMLTKKDGTIRESINRTINDTKVPFKLGDIIPAHKVDAKVQGTEMSFVPRTWDAIKAHIKANKITGPEAKALRDSFFDNDMVTQSNAAGRACIDWLIERGAVLEKGVRKNGVTNIRIIEPAHLVNETPREKTMRLRAEGAEQEMRDMKAALVKAGIMAAPAPTVEATVVA